MIESEFIAVTKGFVFVAKEMCVDFHHQFITCCFSFHRIKTVDQISYVNQQLLKPDPEGTLFQQRATPS